MSETSEWREEWAVGHSQGVHPGPFTRESAEAWIADDKFRDERRRLHARGRQRLLRRFVTDWQEVTPATPPTPTAEVRGE